MTNDEFAMKIENARDKLYKTAMIYMGSHALAMDAIDEAVYKGLCNHKKLKSPEFFDTWIIRILINECYNELRRQKKVQATSQLPETAIEDFDSLPLKEAIRCLPKDLKDIIILRYFSGFTLVETANMLGIPQGTAATRQRKALQLLRLELDEEGKNE